jgi:hypothetical protein
MAGEWKGTTLGECAAWLSGGTPFKGNDAFWSGSIPWISAKDMKSFRLHDAEDHISPLAVSCGGKLVPAGTILLARPRHDAKQRRADLHGHAGDGFQSGHQSAPSRKECRWRISRLLAAR